MDLLACIHQQLGKLTNPTLKELGNALNRIPNISDLITPYITDPDQFPYGRNVIYVNEHVEVIVINLPPHAETAIHDHGQSIGCARVVKGKVLNSIYRENENEIEKVTAYFVNEGKCLYSPPRLIHKMSNFQDQPMISVHVYSPPLLKISNYKKEQEENEIIMYEMEP